METISLGGGRQTRNAIIVTELPYQVNKVGWRVVLRSSVGVFRCLLYPSGGVSIPRSRVLMNHVVRRLLLQAALLEKMAEMVNEKKLDGISDLRDESDREGIRVVSNRPSTYPSDTDSRRVKMDERGPDHAFGSW